MRRLVSLVCICSLGEPADSREWLESGWLLYMVDMLVRCDRGTRALRSASDGGPKRAWRAKGVGGAKDVTRAREGDGSKGTRRASRIVALK